MNTSICGANCAECPSASACRGCVETNGCPFGKQCSIADYILTYGIEAYCAFKGELIEEIKSCGIRGMEAVTELYPLVGSFINLEYPLSNGSKVKFLCDDEIYLGAQVSDIASGEKACCLGVVANAELLLICRYGENCTDPRLVLFKERCRK